MQLYGDLANAEIEGNLLVLSSTGDFPKHLALPRGEQRELSQAFLEYLRPHRLDSVAIYPSRDRIEKGLVAHRFGEKVDGSRFHRLHRHWDVAVSGEEHNWLAISALRQPALEIETTHTGHPHVGD